MLVEQAGASQLFSQTDGTQTGTFQLYLPLVIQRGTIFFGP